jgi:Na+/melibiose symporter-like transporter
VTQRLVGTRLPINRDFGLLWAGQAISSFGDRVFDTSVILWVATRIAPGHSWTPLAVSGVLLCVAVPTVAVGPLAGVFVGSWDRRRTLLTMDALRAVLIVLLLLNSRHAHIVVQLASIYAILALASTCSSFFNPARLALLRDIVPASELTRAAGRQQTTNMLSSIVGPGTAAPLFIALGPQLALAVNGASFLSSYFLISLVRARPADLGPARRDSVRHEFGAGLRYFASNRILMVLLTSIVLVFLGYGAMTALNIFFLTGNLHAPARDYGLLGIRFGPVDTLFTAAGMLEGLAAIVALLSLRAVTLPDAEPALAAQTA